jgi:hypothetical protein
MNQVSEPCCTEDGGGPSGVARQGEASNHLKLLWSRAMVVSVEEKVPRDGIRWGSGRRTPVNR